MNNPRIFADFQNADAKGRLRLNCIGTIEDLSHQGTQLIDGGKLSISGSKSSRYSRWNTRQQL